MVNKINVLASISLCFVLLSIFIVGVAFALNDVELVTLSLILLIAGYICTIEMRLALPINKLDNINK